MWAEIQRRVEYSPDPIYWKIIVLRKLLSVHTAVHTKEVKHMVSNLVMRKTLEIVFQMMKWKHPGGNREG